MGLYNSWIFGDEPRLLLNHISDDSVQYIYIRYTILNGQFKRYGEVYVG